jgi:hypothetical protein
MKEITNFRFCNLIVENADSVNPVVKMQVYNLTNVPVVLGTLVKVIRGKKYAASFANPAKNGDKFNYIPAGLAKPGVWNIALPGIVYV